jgi:hypothetical protein
MTLKSIEIRGSVDSRSDRPQLSALRQISSTNLTESIEQFGETDETQNMQEPSCSAPQPQALVSNQAIYILLVVSNVYTLLFCLQYDKVNEIVLLSRNKSLCNTCSGCA